MSDFDTVLERLVTDPGFARALAADPNAALAGYRLDADEVALLRSQVSAGDGGDRRVEERTSKASMVGLLGSLGGIGTGHQGAAAAVGHELAAQQHHHAGFGPNVPNPYDTPPPAETTAAGPGFGDQPAVGYHPRIDADGDGRWDHYTAVRHADGSVDVYEDRNGDGRIDFVGHDANGDGILQSADYDENFDGHLETHMVDDNGDGWMDRRQVSGQ
jgi:hypothetical protein